MKKIKIAMIAPAFGLKSGPEIITHDLTEVLIKKGLNVTLFAPKDWNTSAKHFPTLSQSVWNRKDFDKLTEKEVANLILMNQLGILKYQNSYDLIHFHSQRYNAAISHFINKPCVLTLHSRLKEREFDQIKKENVKIVSISGSRKAKVSAVIFNGIPVNDIKYSVEKGKYLLAVGRIVETKGFDIAIKIAKEAKKKLLIIGQVGSPETAKPKEYFIKKIKPYLGKDIILKGNLPREKVFEYMRKAEALIVPIKIRNGLSVWPLVSMESFACGTPVIGSKVKLTSKYMYDSSIMCLSNSIEDLVKTAKNTEKFDRLKCRQFAEKNFSVEMMAEKYIHLYKKILQKSVIKNKSWKKYHF